MADDPVENLEAILRQNGREDIDLRENEVDRYFLFDQITDPEDLDRAWAAIPHGADIRQRASHIDAVSDVVEGWGYRIPRHDQRCSDIELADCLQSYLTGMLSLIDETDIAADPELVKYLANDFPIKVVHDTGPTIPDAMENVLFLSLYETLSDFMLSRLDFDKMIQEVLYDWAVYYTKCNEVAAYLLWPLIAESLHNDGRDEQVIRRGQQTMDAAFTLWRLGCRDRYWAEIVDRSSSVNHVQPPW